jgi:hypothetical protein
MYELLLCSSCCRGELNDNVHADDVASTTHALYSFLHARFTKVAGLDETATCLARHPVTQSLGPIDRLRTNRQFSVK